ncbi:MAG: EAL domain-containing protein [Burkholderiales bacterium]|nr:EAL domain-containing protein [Burkholderiales bacterium]
MPAPSSPSSTPAAAPTDATATALRLYQRVEAQQAALLDVVRGGILANDFAAACRQLNEVTAQALGVERASIWLMNDAGDALVLQDLYLSSEGLHSGGMVLRQADFPRYFEALNGSRAISAVSARSDPRTAEFTTTYLVPLGIESMLDACIWRGGASLGVVCVESVGNPRDWQPDEQQFAASVADLVAMAHETEERRQAEARLRASEQRFEVSFRLNPDNMVLVRAADNVIVEVNRNFEEQTGYTIEELRGQTIMSLHLWTDQAEMREWNRLIADTGKAMDFEASLRLRSGEVRRFQLSSERVHIGNEPFVLTAARDITRARRQEQIVRQLSDSMAGATGAGFFRTLVAQLADSLGADMAFVGELADDADGHVRTVAVWRDGREAPNFTYLLQGSPCTNVLGDGMCCYPDRVAELFPEDRPLAQQGMRAYVGAPLLDSGGHALGLMSVLFRRPLDDSEMAESLLRIFAIRAAAELERLVQLKELEFRASHDLLSGLPNRLRLERTIAEQMGQRRGPAGEPRRGALLLIDLDRFKEINDTLGHAVGDTLLLRAAKRLQSEMRQSYDATVARLGGDEFGIWLPEAGTAEVAEAAARRALAAITAPFDISGYRLEIGASIGIALYPDHGESATELFRRADIAMYQAKRSGAGCEIYNAEEDPYSPARLGLMSQLGSAVRAGEFELYFQPRLTLTDRKLAGFEALVRWRHPQLGLLPPGQFIPLAEISDAIRPLTLWIFDAALKQQAAWRASGAGIPVAINLSPRLLMDRSCPDQIEALLRRHDSDPTTVECEVTESSLIVDTGRVSETLRQLHGMGLKIAIDDFGTGYSSLSHLKRLPLHALKIDVSFVTHMIANEQDAAIVSSTIGLAHNLGLSVVAEGIEDEDTLKRLTELGCNEGQGFWIARPMPAAEAASWLR